MKIAMLILLIGIVATGSALAARKEEDVSPQGRTGWARLIGYWVFTVVVAFEMVAGSLWDLLRIEYVRAALTHLGYPLYLPFITGVWKFPCALALLVPRFARLKEWAYAGAIFNYTGAVASYLLMGDGARDWVAPLVFAVFTLASWALRPPSRRLPAPATSAKLPAVNWCLPILIAAAMLVFSSLTLPKGAPPL